MRKIKPKSMTVCGSGFIKCNKHRYHDAAIVLYRPNMGFIRIAFGTGDNLDEEDCCLIDSNGNRVDDYLYITTYTDWPEESVWLESRVYAKEEPRAKTGLLLEETDGGQMLYSKKSYPRGDIRDMLKDAMKFMGWPTDAKRYFVVGYERGFWEKPHPLGYRPKKSSI